MADLRGFAGEVQNLTDHDMDLPIKGEHGDYWTLGPGKTAAGGTAGPKSSLQLTEAQKDDLLKNKGVKNAIERGELRLV